MLSNPDSVKRPCPPRPSDVSSWTTDGRTVEYVRLAELRMDQDSRDIKALEDDNAELLQGLADANGTNKTLFEQTTEQAGMITRLWNLLSITKATMDAQPPRGPDDVRLSMYIDAALEGEK